MKKTILGIFVCTLLIAATVLPAAGTMNIGETQVVEKSIGKENNKVGQEGATGNEGLLQEVSEKVRPIELTRIEGLTENKDIEKCVLAKESVLEKRGAIDHVKPPEMGTAQEVLLYEDFESGMIPSGWTVIVTEETNNNPYNLPTFWSIFDSTIVATHSGMYQAGLWWSYSHQDEWLITPEIDLTGCYYPELRFWTYAYYNPPYESHNYIKISTDHGETWTVLVDLCELIPEGWNEYATPIRIALPPYAGETVMIAWHALSPLETGVCCLWMIDDIEIVCHRPIDWQKVIQFLKSCQNADGGFGARSGEPSDMRVTGFVVEALKSDLAPNGNRLAFMEENIDVATCISWLSSCQNPDGGFGIEPGAPSEVGYAYFGVHSLMMFGFEDFPVGYPEVKPPVNITREYLSQFINVTALIDWLLSLQNPDGGFGNYPGGASRATCCGQHGMLLGYDFPDIEAAISWYQAAQNADGGFGMTHEDPSTVTGTYFCVNALAYLGRHAHPEVPTVEWLQQVMNYSDCISWLKNLQNLDGGWGNQPGKPSKLFLTDTARTTLEILGTQPTNVQSCLSFARSCYNPDGGFGSQLGEPSHGQSTFSGVEILHELDIIPPEVGTSVPQDGYLYIFGREIIPIDVTLIIGRITVEVNATDEIGIDRVEFYIDDVMKYNDTNPPYEWLWDETIFFKHTLKVIAYDKAENYASDEQVVWIFNI